MKKKIVPKAMKKFLSKMRESKILRKLFFSQIDYRKIEEMKREMHLKYSVGRFF